MTGGDRPGPCPDCGPGQRLPFPLRMAFQPILEAGSGRVFAQEALVRGPQGEAAGWVLDRVAARQRYAFDQSCRATAIAEAARLGVAETGARLSINFLPNAVRDPRHCLRSTLRAAERTRFPISSLIFELTEGERVRDPARLRWLVDAYRDLGLAIAIDDFGAGHAGLALLADMRPDIVKLDMALVRGIAEDRGRRVLVAAMRGACEELGIGFVAEGVETRAEYETLLGLGVGLFQGHLMGRPALESLAPAGLPGAA